MKIKTSVREKLTNDIEKYYNEEVEIISEKTYWLGIAIIAIVEKDLEKNLRMLESEDNKLKETKERVLDFASYIISYRHIESVKKGKNLYPELRYNDSMYVYNKFKNVYEEKRIRYENGEKKQVLYEIENEKEQE